MFDKNKWNQITKQTLISLRDLPEKVLRFKPSNISDSWSIHEHIIHIVDSEVNAFLRLKSILGQSGTNTFVIDENSWVNEIDYEKEDLNDYLSLFEILRKIEGNLLENCFRNYTLYSTNFVIHNQFGKIDLNTWVDVYSENHLKSHLEYIVRNVKEWQKAPPTTSNETVE